MFIKEFEASLRILGDTNRTVQARLEKDRTLLLKLAEYTNLDYLTKDKIRNIYFSRYFSALLFN